MQACASPASTRTSGSNSAASTQHVLGILVSTERGAPKLSSVPCTRSPDTESAATRQGEQTTDMPSFSLQVYVLVLSILSAQAGAEETSGVAEPGCDCQLAYLAGAANPVRITVHMHRSIWQQDTIDDIAGLDPFTAGDDDDNLKIQCACNLTYTADWNPLAFESTEALIEEHLRRAQRQSQGIVQSVYNFIATVLECIDYFFTTVLPQWLLKAIVSACVHVIYGGVKKSRRRARECSELF